MPYKGPCGCEITDIEYDHAQTGRENIEHGLAVTSWPVRICPKCHEKTNAMWWMGHE